MRFYLTKDVDCTLKMFEAKAKALPLLVGHQWTSVGTRVSGWICYDMSMDRLAKGLSCGEDGIAELVLRPVKTED